MDIISRKLDPEVKMEHEDPNVATAARYSEQVQRIFAGIAENTRSYPSANIIHNKKGDGI